MISSPNKDASTVPDLSVCEREAIHIPGSVEPNGVLLVLQEPDLTVAQVSANAGRLLGIEAEALLGVALADVLEPQSFDALRSRMSAVAVDEKRRYVAGVRVRAVGNAFDASIHRFDGALILELEPSIARANEGHPELYASLSDAIAGLQGRMELNELCQRVATYFRSLSGFDRVMVYRFLEDDTGWVIAEDCREDMTPYLGLRYPASDIPRQARRLYLLNTLRLKADVNAPRVALVPPLNALTGRPLDMSHCVLRAMSPVHDEYLRNMGVAATMSVSILEGERLWGLIACHHTTPKTVPHPLRISCEVLAGVFSSHIAAAEQHEKLRNAESLVAYRKELSEVLRIRPDASQVLHEEGARLGSIIDAAGGAICVGGEIALFGVTPTREDVRHLVEWLNINQPTHLFYTDKLSERCPGSERFSDTASGLMSARIALGGKDFILWFRPPAVKVVEWGGNPAKPVQDSEAGKRISPRLSFERWKETVGDRSEPWRDYQREFASALRRTVAEALLVRKNEEVTRLNDELERSNIELDAFAYAASHDLQEPVRTVRAYAQLLKRRSGDKLDDQARELVSVIESSAARMGNLISALLTYGQVGGSTLRERKPVNFDDLIRVAMMNLIESIRSSAAVITHDPLPTMDADPDQMTQVFQNLIGNSIKYRKPDEPPRIHISVIGDDRLWRFSVQDNGQGFQREEAAAIFGAFKRLHGRDIPGTGIGLALCKRIVEHHGGRIWAESKGGGQGAILAFTLPKS